MGEINLGTLLAKGKKRDINIITDEILELKQTAGEAIIGIGQRLIEAKAVLPHGEWLPWLNDKVDFSERIAQQFMRLAQEWTNPKALSDLGKTKALALLALPTEEREKFIDEVHEVDGAEKTVVDMTSRELDKAIRERKEAIETAEQARLDAKAAEESRAKMEQEIKTANVLLAAAESDREAAQAEIARLGAELKKLKEAPVDVAVMEVDQAAIDKAVEEASANLQIQLDAVKEDRAAEIDKLTRHLQTVMAEKEQADQALATANRQLADAQAKLEEAKKPKDTAQQDKELTEFEFYFNQAQETANKLRGMLLKARSRGDTNTAEKLKKALKALGEAIGRAAE